MGHPSAQTSPSDGRHNFKDVWVVAEEVVFKPSAPADDNPPCSNPLGEGGRSAGCCQSHEFEGFHAIAGAVPNRGLGRHCSEQTFGVSAPAKPRERQRTPSPLRWLAPALSSLLGTTCAMEGEPIICSGPS